MKKRKFSPGEYWILVGGILLIAFAVLFFLAAAGKEKLLVSVMTGLGIVAVIAGFLIGAFAGSAAAFGIIWVLVQIMEVFTKGFGYIFLAGGIAMIIWWLIECFPKQSASYTSSGSSGSSSEKSSSERSSFSSEPVHIYWPEWDDYKDRKDYKEIHISLGDTDANYAAFLVLDEGTRLYITGNVKDDSRDLSLEYNGKFSHFCTLRGDLLDKMMELSPKVMFVSKVSKAPGNTWADLRCFRT